MHSNLNWIEQFLTLTAVCCVSDGFLFLDVLQLYAQLKCEFKLKTASGFMYRKKKKSKACCKEKMK